jgi:hypothetical protein
MKKKKYSSFEIRRRISKCKKRLHNLSIQGFSFSEDIYDEIDLIEEKIHQNSIINQINRKNLPFILGTIIVLFSIVAIAILIPKPPPPSLNIEVTNLTEGQIIKKDFLIKGTAVNQNGEISNVQINIDSTEESSWEEVNFWKSYNDIYLWNFSLLMDNITYGYHRVYFRCLADEAVSNIINRSILFIQKPMIEVIYPYDGISELKGKINITGSANGFGQEIKNVKIRIRDDTISSWDDAILSSNKTWYYLWDTNELYNESYVIEVKCNNGVDSIISKINVSVNTTLINYEEKLDMSPFNKTDYFQIYCPPTTRSIKPNKNYELRMFYRHRKLNSILPLIPYLSSIVPMNIRIDEITHNPKYLTVSPPEDIIKAYPDNVTNYVSYIISISDDAPKDKICTFTIAYTTYIINEDSLFNNHDTIDVALKTGQW